MNNAGGNTDGLIAAWGFEPLASDYSITSSKSPANQAQLFGSSFSTNYSYAYTGTSAPTNATIRVTVPQDINYTNELYDGFSCTGTNPKICNKTILSPQWVSGGSQTLQYTLPAYFGGNASSYDKLIKFQIFPDAASSADMDLYPYNNISNSRVTVDPTVPATPDFYVTPTLITTGQIALNSYGEVKVDYGYTGPPAGISDKRIRVTIPDGLIYDDLNRAGFSNCTATGIIPQICDKNFSLNGSSYSGSF